MPKLNVILVSVMIKVKAWNKAILRLSSGTARPRTKAMPELNGILVSVMLQAMVWNKAILNL